MSDHQLEFLRSVPTLSLEEIKGTILENPQWMHPGDLEHHFKNLEAVSAFWVNPDTRFDVLKFFLDSGFKLFDEHLLNKSLGKFVAFTAVWDRPPANFDWFLENWTREMLKRDGLTEVSEAAKLVGLEATLNFYKGGLGSDPENHPCLLHIASRGEFDFCTEVLVKEGLSAHCPPTCKETPWLVQLYSGCDEYTVIPVIEALGYSHPIACV